jgi:hypothetical protein
MAYKNKVDQAASSRRHYLRNQKAMKERAELKNRERHAEYAEKIKVAKARPCADCNIEYPHYVMDFDHVRGKKVGNVSTMAHALRPWKLIEQEIAKCDVVCSNCHRERTYVRLSA